MKNEKKEMPAKFVRECLDYDPDTGILTWRWRPDSHFTSKESALRSNARFAGNIAGSDTGSGYSAVFISGSRMYSHRLAWIITFGDLSVDLEIDHISGRRGDNRLVNLRAVSRSENHKNTKKPRTNSSGRIGVSWHKASQKWRVDIKVDGKGKSLGVFQDFEDAVLARKSAETELGFHPNHGRS